MEVLIKKVILFVLIGIFLIMKGNSMFNENIIKSFYYYMFGIIMFIVAFITYCTESVLMI